MIFSNTLKAANEVEALKDEAKGLATDIAHELFWQAGNHLAIEQNTPGAGPGKTAN